MIKIMTTAVLVTLTVGNVAFAGLSQQEKNDIYYLCRGGEGRKVKDNPSIKQCRDVVKKVESIVDAKNCQ
jgi:hypothetical protein